MTLDEINIEDLGSEHFDHGNGHFNIKPLRDNAWMIHRGLTPIFTLHHEGDTWRYSTIGAGPNELKFEDWRTAVLAGIRS